MMKRSLALGCAAVAFAATSGTALAQAKFDVTVGGDAFLQGAFVDQDDDAGLRSFEMRNRFRLVVTPTAKADNGLEYGGRVRIRAAQANRSNDADRAYIFASGAFGTVQGGVINGLSDEYGIIGPNVEGIAGGPDNATLEFLTGSSSYNQGTAALAQNFRNLVSGDIGTKVVYLTPKFAGFTGGVSYMPRTGNHNTSVDRRERLAIAGGQRAVDYQDVVEVGANYANEFGAVSVEASAYYQFGKATDTTGGGLNTYEDLSSYNIGVNVGFAGFKVGAMYMNAGESGYNKNGVVNFNRTNQDVWILGANYTTGPFILAANYLRYKDAGDLTISGNSKMDLYQAGVTYVVAPGLTAGLEYSYFKFRSDDRATFPNDKGSIIMLDTRLAF